LLNLSLGELVFCANATVQLVELVDWSPYYRA